MNTILSQSAHGAQRSGAHQSGGTPLDIVPSPSTFGLGDHQYVLNGWGVMAHIVRVRNLSGVVLIALAFVIAGIHHRATETASARVAPSMGAGGFAPESVGLRTTQVVTVGAEPDCTIIDFQGNNLCSSNELIAGRFQLMGSEVEYRALLRFDVASALPPDAEITDARLVLHTVSGSHGGRVSGHPTLKPWTTSVNWFEYASGQSWTQLGGDFGPAAETVDVGQGAALHRWNLTDVVRAWDTGTIANHGILLRHPDPNTVGTRAAFVSSESADQASRPRLEITYQPDSSQPDVNVAGVPYEDRAEVLPKDLYHLPIDVADVSSGVTRVRVLVDGTPLLDRSQPCPGGACDMEVDDFRLDARNLQGTHTIAVVATDAAGNEGGVSWNAMFDGVPVFPGGTDPAVRSVPSGTATVDCGTPGQLRRMASQRPVGIANGTWAPRSGRRAAETTLYYANGSYRVNRCASDRSLRISQLVVRARVPFGETASIPISQTVPDPRSGGYETSYSTLPDAEDPHFVAAWRKHGREIVASVMPPTDGPAMAPSGLSRLNETPCSYDDWQDTGRELPSPFGFLAYKFNFGTLPPEQPGTNIAYNRARFTNRLLSAARTWSWGRNRCRFPQQGGVNIEPSLELATSARAHERDGTNTIDLGGDETIGGACMPGSIACTRWRPDGGEEIEEVDIRLNVRHRGWTGLRDVPSDSAGSPFDLWSVMAHEFGHAIGLAHVSEAENAPFEVNQQIMYFRFRREEERRYLQGADYTGMCVKYIECVEP
jgi:hypothetical protein